MIMLLSFSDSYSWQLPKKTIRVWVQYPRQAREIPHQDILTPELYEYEENPKGEGIANPILNTTLHDKISRTLQTPNKKCANPQSRGPKPPHQKGANPQPQM